MALNISHFSKTPLILMLPIFSSRLSTLQTTQSRPTKSLLENRKAKQVGSLYTSMILGMVAGVGVSVINTRLLGPQEFGDLKFLQTLFTFVVTFLTFGLFVSGSRLLAQEKGHTIKHELIGGLILLAAIVSVLLSVGLFSFSWFEQIIFNNNLGRIIRIFSPFLFVYPFQLCLENIMQGDNRIYELAAFRISPPIIYLLAAVSFNYFVPLKLVSALGIYIFALALSILILLFLFKPKFKKMTSTVLIIWKENKSYGFQVYIGILAGVLTAHLGGLSIAYFIDNTNVGFFSLALTITMPLTMIPNAVGTTFFKDFANLSSIPQKTTVATALLSLCALILFLLVIKKAVIFLYSHEYTPVIQITYFTSIGSVLHGLGDYFNRFLGAHGKGKKLRNSALVVGASNILGYSVLVYAFGLRGAAITKTASGFVYFFTMYLFYKSFTAQIQSHKCSRRN